VDMAIKQWIGSPGHLANFLGDYTHSAIAVVEGNNGVYFT